MAKKSVRALPTVGQTPASIDWDQFVALLVKRLGVAQQEVAKAHPTNGDLGKRLDSQHKWFVNVARSSGLRKAFEGLPGTMQVDFAILQAIEIIKCLRNIVELAKYRNSPDSLVDPIDELRVTRQRAIDQLHPTDPVVAVIKAEAFPMSLEHQLASGFDPKNLKRKGKAKDRAGAFNGWMIRELDRRVPSKSPKRATAIAALLALADVQVDAQNVTTILKRSKT